MRKEKLGEVESLLANWRQDLDKNMGFSLVEQFLLWQGQ